MVKGQPPKFKPSVWHFPVSETGSKCDLVFRHADSEGRVELGIYISSQSVLQGVQNFTLNLGWSKIL